MVLEETLERSFLGKFNICPFNRASLKHWSKIITTDSSYYYFPSCLNTEAEPASERLCFRAKLKHTINNVEGKEADYDALSLKKTLRRNPVCCTLNLLNNIKQLPY